MTIYSVSLVNGRWCSAHIAAFSGGCVDGCPSFSPDGSGLLFASNRLDPECVAQGTPNELDIWVVQREGSSWSRPVRLGESVNSEGREYCPTMTSDGTLYFDGEGGGLGGSYGLYCSSFVDSTFTARRSLPAALQSKHPDFSMCVAPDGTYLVFASFRPGGHGKADLYASFALAGGEWSPPVNLGPTINTGANERFPGVTRDGEFLFFVSDRRIEGAQQDEPGNGLGDVYWVRSEVVRWLRPED
jgi:Tol biopolymer transport system component